MVATTLVVPDAPSIQAKLDVLESTLNAKVYERNETIRTAVVALIARKHHLQVGIHGIGKTFLVDELIKLISGLQDHYFRTLIMKTTTPPEIFGPPSLKALRELDVYRFNPEGMLPAAFVAFMDEFFKGNSPLLNTLLTIMNEGIWFNGGVPVKLDLGTIFTGSNELPTGSDMAPIWDRVTFRSQEHPLKDPANRKRMYRARLAQRRGLMPAVEPVISWDDFLVAQEEAAQVDIPDSVLDAFEELIAKLAKEEIHPSERRQNDCITIIQANAYRDGQMVADIEHLRILEHVLWMTLDQQGTVHKLVMELASPLERAAHKLIDEVHEIGAKIDKIVADNDNMTQRRREGTVLSGKLSRIEAELKGLSEEAKDSPRQYALIESAKKESKAMVKRLLRDLWGRTE